MTQARDIIELKPAESETSGADAAEGQAATSGGSEIPVEELQRMTADIIRNLKTVYDPEIPVDIYELGLIYKVDISDSDGVSDVYVQMTLTSPGCPVAQEMPGWVQGAIMPIDGVGVVDVEIIWDPPWDPSMMSETAKMQLNMFT